MNKKIAIYTEHPLTVYGGLERVLASAFKCLSQKGHSVRIVVIAPKKALVSPFIDWFKEIPVFKYEMTPGKLLRLVCWLRLLFRKPNKSIMRAVMDDLRRNGIPDLALVTNPELISELNLVMKRTGAKTCIYYWDHGLTSVSSYWLSGRRGLANLRFWIYAWLYLQIFKKTIRSVDGVLAISTGIKEFFFRFIQKEKIHVIFNPVEKQGEKLARPANPPKFIYVGRLTDFDKNISFLLQSLSRLKDEVWSLDIFGSGPDQNKLKNLSLKLGLENKIRWLGFFSEPFSLEQECTALLLTSRFEGFPLVLVEANLHGIPVISSNCQAGPGDIVIEGVNGYLFPEGDLETFVNILRKVIRGELNFASPEEIARTAERFSPETFYERLKSALGL